MNRGPAEDVGRARAFWDAAAEAEAAVARFGGDDRDDPAAEAVARDVLRRVRPTDRVVDLGCGTGAVARRIARRCAEVVGVDWSAAALVEARRRAGEAANLRWIATDGRSLAGLADRSVDFVSATLFFLYVAPDVAAAYAAEIRRVLRPGGACMLEFHTAAAVARLAPTHGLLGVPTPLVAYDEDAARALALAAGLTPTDCERRDDVFDLLAVARPSA